MVMNRTFNEILGVAVPLFYLVDGFLTARAQSRLLPPAFGEVARKSAKRLLVPWLIFNVIYVGLRALMEWRGLVPDRLLLGRPPAEALGHIWNSHVASQLYFLPTLFLMRLAAVPCRRIVVGPISWLIVFGMGYVVVMRGVGMTLGDDPIRHAIVEFPYFLFGCLIYRLESLSSRRATTILLVLAAAAVAQRFPPTSGPLEAVSFDVAKYGYAALAYFGSKFVAGTGSPLLWLGGRTMEIYLLHSPVLIRVVRMGAAKFIGPNWTRYVAVWSLTLLLTVAIVLVLERFPKSKRLFGGA